jgi:hypothetical protein
VGLFSADDASLMLQGVKQNSLSSLSVSAKIFKSAGVASDREGLPARSRGAAAEFHIRTRNMRLLLSY